MTEPLVDPDDLGTYLNDSKINQDRAQMMIDDAMALAAPIFMPNVVPVQAAGVIRRMAGRGYVTTTTTRAAQISEPGAMMGTLPGALGGVIISRYDRADLEAIRDQVYASTSSSGAFSIDLLPAGYVLPLSPWDTGVVGVEGFGSTGTDDQDGY